MAKSNPELDNTKKAIKRDIQGQIDAADYAMGIKTPEGKAFNRSNTTSGSKKNNSTDQKIDIDDYLKQAERGYTDITPQEKDEPFNNNLLRNVKIKRISKGDGKY